MTEQARRLFVLQFGAERVPKGLSLQGHGSGPLYWEPLTGALIETDDGWVLYDTGMSRTALDSDAVQDSYRASALAFGSDPAADAWALTPEPQNRSRWNWGHPGDPLVAALASVGLSPRDLTLAVVSHLHLDHSGGIPTLAAAGVPVAIQGAELDFAQTGAVGLADGFHAADWSAPETTFVRLDGDATVAPGVTVLHTPGHTPGHSSLVVRLPDTGTWIFPGDAADLAQNLQDGVPCGSCAGQSPEDEQAARESFRRLLAEASAHDGRLVPGHDQVVVNAVRHPSGGHR